MKFDNDYEFASVSLGRTASLSPKSFTPEAIFLPVPRALPERPDEVGANPCGIGFTDVPVGSPPRQTNFPTSDKSSTHSVEITSASGRYQTSANTPTRNAGQTTSQIPVSSAMKEP